MTRPPDAAAGTLGTSASLGLNGEIAAGYTYLGQFIDHDITFDPTSKLQRDNDPEALIDFRTPRFDLDSVYGSGPVDEPYLYDWRDPEHPGARMLIGAPSAGHDLAAEDLPRNHQGRALIGDARNDEHVIIAQLHLLFLRFHNQVVEHLRAPPGHVDADELFEEAQRLVRWHYQWIVRHDYLPKVVGDPRPAFTRRLFTWGEEPFMPVEFSGAAFRFGHSMVRDSYKLSRHGDSVETFLAAGAGSSDGSDHLGGFRPLPAPLVIEWERFFQVPDAPEPVMDSMCIDTHLAGVLKSVPPHGAALARLNLQRGRALGLPAGADVAAALGERPLSEAELRLDGVTEPQAHAALKDATPLWYYVLCEAAVDGVAGTHLGPVGGRIVAEVLIGLLEADPSSYLRRYPDWRPELGRTDGDFTMGDLVHFTQYGEGHPA